MNIPALQPFYSHRYQTQAELGSGSMGVVYYATDRLTRQGVALKVVKQPEEMLDFGFVKSSRELRLDLAQEFKLLASLRHPHIISVLDYGFTTLLDAKTALPFFTMELLQHPQPITEAAEKHSTEAKIDLIFQLLQALAYLHRRGIIHRDLKPANVMAVGQQVKVLDFGLALARKHLTEQPSAAGTLAYMAPEVIQGEPASPASDLYAVGVIAYEIFTQKRPFEASNIFGLMDVILEELPDLTLLPTQLQPFVGRLLAKAPQDRYPDVQSALNVCRGLFASPPPLENVTIRESFLQAAQFVGRDAEITQLSAALQQACQGQGSAWLISGESGIGKSRLLDEIRTQALVEGALVLQGQAVAEGGAPYLLWRDLLRHLCLEVTLTDLEASVLKALVPDLPTLLERPIPDAPDLEPVAAQNRLFTSIEEVLRRQSVPMVILLEDLHWAKEGLALLKRLLNFVPHLPLLILGSYRDEERPDLPAELPTMQLIKLERLSPQTIADLSASMLGEDIGRRGEVVSLISQETEGNLLFIVEVVRALAEEVGDLARIGAATLPPRVFAQGMQTILERRLHQVPDHAYALLEVAAISGRQLDLKVLRAAAPHIDLVNWLQSCAEAAVLEVREELWRFSHDKLRETLLHGLSPASYRQHHGTVAAALEQAYPDDPSQNAALAYHWGEAQQPAKEALYAARAGEDFLVNAAYQAAIPLLERALALSYEQPQLHKGISLLEQKLGEAYLGLGMLDQGEAHLKNVLVLAGYAPYSENRQLMKQLLRQAAHRLYLLPWRTLPPEQISPHLAAVRACTLLMEVNFFRNDKVTGLYYTVLGLNIAELTGQQGLSDQARVHATLGVGLWLVKARRLSVLYTNQALRLIAKFPDPNPHSWIMLMTGIAATCRADWVAARQRLNLCMSLAQELGHIRRWEEGAVGLAGVAYFDGHWDESIELGKALAESAGRQGNQQGVAWGLDDQARIALRRGDYPQALAWLQQSQIIYEVLEDNVGKIWVYGALAQVYLRLDDLPQARHFAELAAQLLGENIPTTYGVVEGYWGWAEVALHDFEADAALQAAADAACAALEHYAEVFNTGKVLACIFRSRYEASLGNYQKAVKLARQGVYWGGRFAMPYDEALAHMQLVRLLPEAQHKVHLQQAMKLFDELKVVWKQRD